VDTSNSSVPVTGFGCSGTNGEAIGFHLHYRESGRWVDQFIPEGVVVFHNGCGVFVAVGQAPHPKESAR
jgi:hypothetical protein